MLAPLRSRKAAVAAFLILSALPLLAATPATGPWDDDAEAGEEQEEDETENWRDQLTLTQGSVTVGGEDIEYTATTGTMTLEREDGSDRADMFFVAYTRNGVDESSMRPITFCFNGGPGSSSVWLHLGAHGPRRVVLPSDASMPAPAPYLLEDNPHTLLDLTDIVFIDPVTTGFSRAAGGEDDKQFHGVSEDIASVADFIRLYTTRAAGLAGNLQDRHGMFLNGIVLVSSILDFSTARFVAGNDLPYPLFLPTYTATAWYHGRLAPELQADLRATLNQVEAFARDDYTLALARGTRLPNDERDRIATQLSRFTGVSEDYVKQTNLRIVIYEPSDEALKADIAQFFATALSR